MMKVMYALTFSMINTLNVDVFTLYIFSRNSRLLKVRKNMRCVKITSYCTIWREYYEECEFISRRQAQFPQIRENLYTRNYLRSQ